MPDYKGILKEPIVKPQILLHTEEEQRAFIEKEWLRKLEALQAYFGITNSVSFFSLALALACEHVPGFKVVDEKPKRGRPKKLTYHNKSGNLDIALKGVRLLLLVETYKQKLGTKKDAVALKAIIENETSFSDYNRAAGFDTLQTHFDQVKSASKDDNTLANLLIKITKDCARGLGATDEHQLDQHVREIILNTFVKYNELIK